VIARFRLSDRVLGAASLGDIMEDQHTPDTVPPASRMGAALSSMGISRPSGRAGSMIGQRDGLPFAQDAATMSSPARGLLVDNAEDALRRLAQDFTLRPAGGDWAPD